MVELGRIGNCDSNYEKEGVMKCKRCGGTMAYERFYGPHDQFNGWRCILCGEIIDPVICANRLSQRGQR